MLILCIADVERDVGMKNLSPKEAITILEGMRIDIPVPKAAVTQIKRNSALDMAINALELFGNSEQLPPIQPDTTTHDSIPAEPGKNDDVETSGDCISRTQAIDEIHEDADWLASQGSDWQVERMERDKSILMSLPSVQPEQQWIPCSERQPDKEGDYLVTLLDDGITWVEIALWNETFGGRWQAVLYNDVDYSDISNVIAWKPLPEPYHEGREE